MARVLPLPLRGAMNAAVTDAVPVLLITFDHPEIAAPVRISSDMTRRLAADEDTGTPIYGTRSRGHDYLFCPMSMILPDDQEGGPPQARLAIDNVDRRIGDLARSIPSRMTATLEIVLAAAPDDVDASFEDFEVNSASGDASQVTISLSQEWFTAEPYPAGCMTPTTFPGLFR